jgi:hypothetical protein
LTKFVSPDDEQDVLQTCRELKIKKEYIVKNYVSRWSFTKNHNMIHGQKNVKNQPTFFIKVIGSRKTDKFWW